MVHEDKSPFSDDHVNLIFFFLEGYTEDVTIAQISVAILWCTIAICFKISHTLSAINNFFFFFFEC
jgi:hypothetical protein